MFMCYNSVLKIFSLNHLPLYCSNLILHNILHHSIYFSLRDSTVICLCYFSYFWMRGRGEMAGGGMVRGLQPPRNKTLNT